MGITYDTTGLSIQTLSEILDEREANLQTFLGSDFTISGDNAIANLQLADADREYDIQELLLYIAMQLDPDQAEGIWLDFICALNNIKRRSPEKTVIPITVTGALGVSKTAGEITIVDTSTDEYFINSNAFTIDSTTIVSTTTGTTINTTTTYTTDIAFTATSFGDIKADSSHTFEFKSASSGLTGVSWDIGGTYSVGRYAESDADLRARRTQTLEITASSTLASIKANVSEVDGVIYYNGYENDTNTTVNTIPTKAFEIVVLGGSDQDIAQAILEKKPAGIQAYGSTTISISDTDGNAFNIGFTRPTETPVAFNIAVKVTSDQSSTWVTTVTNSLINSFESTISVGDDIYVSKFYCILNNYPEILDISTFQVKKVSGGTWASSYATTMREIATIAANNITITQTT